MGRGGGQSQVNTWRLPLPKPREMRLTHLLLVRKEKLWPEGQGEEVAITHLVWFWADRMGFLGLGLLSNVNMRTLGWEGKGWRRGQEGEIHI